MVASDFRKEQSLQQAKLMHLRLGHFSIKQLHIFYPDIDSTLFKNSFICTIFPAAKQTRKSFPLSSIKTTTPFQTIHLDVWGPYSKATYNDCTFFVTIVDDYTSVTWVYLIKRTSQCATILQQFLNSIHTEFNAHVHIVRADDAKELCEGEILDIYHKHGIQHQTSNIYTPQQNGVMERKHCYLLEVTRALKFQSNLPSCFKGIVFLLLHNY